MNSRYNFDTYIYVFNERINHFRNNNITEKVQEKVEKVQEEISLPQHENNLNEFSEKIIKNNNTQRTEGRLNLNFQAHPYEVAFLNP